MLEQLLKYHQNLISDEFVQKILNRIQKQYQVRMIVLGIFGFCGAIATFFAVKGFLQLAWFASFQDLMGHNMWANLVLGVILMIICSGTLWMFSDDFESI